MKMEGERYCVYNQTSETFLSLGVGLGEGLPGRLKAGLRPGASRMDEGYWFVRPKKTATWSLGSRRDLIYLDENQSVIDVNESFPRLSFAALPEATASLLNLPMRTIYSSQTQPGNQLVICRAEEIEGRLKSISPLGSKDPVVDLELESESGPEDSHARSGRERRRAARMRWPRLVSFDSQLQNRAAYGIRDISARGLYLTTAERWPLGTQVRMSLQRTDDGDEKAAVPITIQMRVSRWGADGVGLEFIDSPEKNALIAMQIR